MIDKCEELIAILKGAECVTIEEKDSPNDEKNLLTIVSYNTSNPKEKIIVTLKRNGKVYKEIEELSSKINIPIEEVAYTTIINYRNYTPNTQENTMTIRHILAMGEENKKSLSRIFHIYSPKAMYIIWRLTTQIENAIIDNNNIDKIILKELCDNVEFFEDIIESEDRYELPLTQQSINYVDKYKKFKERHVILNTIANIHLENTDKSLEDIDINYIINELRSNKDSIKLWHILDEVKEDSEPKNV